MVGLLLVVSWVFPLVLAACTPWVRARWPAALAPLPALGAALLLPAGSSVVLDSLFLGVHLELDEPGRLFLGFGALVWLLAGVSLAFQADRGSRRLRLFFLLAMAGNLLLVLAADMLTFYLGFAAMGLSTYGLVVHRGGQRARRAGRVYLAWTLVGELALFSAVAMMVAASGSTLFADLAGLEIPALAVGLLIFGFGIKLALPGLHVWLPLAYPAAPALAAAVLSGPMINAGLLGWLRFLPPDGSLDAGWGSLLVALGAAGIVLGTVAGLAQRDPRAVLGYSSIAKMGLVSAVFGIVASQPQLAGAALPALVLFAVHHSLVKSALFLGIGAWERIGARTWLMIVLAVPALALAGAPLTAGAIAKEGLGGALAGAGPDLLFMLSALGTALLMIRLFWLLRLRPARRASGGGATLTVAATAAALSLWLPFTPADLSFSAGGVAPLAVALGLAAGFWTLTRSGALKLPRIPPGDLLQLLPKMRRFSRDFKGSRLDRRVRRRDARPASASRGA